MLMVLPSRSTLSCLFVESPFELSISDVSDESVLVVCSIPSILIM
nr:MAG TPA: hypothetical protein [Caudoviricetes sp.]